MNIDDLIERLEEARDNHGGNTEVRLAIQPGYPLVTRTDSGGIYDPNEDDDPVFIIAAGEDLEHGSPEMWGLGF